MLEHELQEESPLIAQAKADDRALRDTALHDYAAASFASHARGLIRIPGTRPWLRRLLGEELDLINKLRREAGKGVV